MIGQLQSLQLNSQKSLLLTMLYKAAELLLISDEILLAWMQKIKEVLKPINNKAEPAYMIDHYLPLGAAV